VYTFHDEQLFARLVIEARAQGYVTKEAGSDALVSALRRVINGEMAYSQTALQTMLNTGTATELESLSPREREVWALMGQRLTNPEIAARLHLSTHRIENIKLAMKNKLNLRSTKDLEARAVLYFHHGTLPPPGPVTDESDLSAGMI
jgi:DNA-binding NarL/FixJ family response regulator